MTPSHVEQARVQARAARARAIGSARRAFRSLEKESTPAALEHAVALCRVVVAADDRLERLGVARG